MRWVNLVVVALVLHSVLSEEDGHETNDVSPVPPKFNLDSNLRRALLKALSELENEEQNKPEYTLGDDSKEKTIEKASAASVSIYSNGNSVTVPPISTTTLTSTTPEKVSVVFQRSQSIQQPSITTIEKDEESENILTSASSNFANQPFGKGQTEKLDKSNNQNSITISDKSVTKIVKVTTSSPPTISTEESEAKVENVQFFSAPLVAAFTVHQDEQGLPQKVEPIFRTHIPTKSQEDIILEKEQQIKLAKQQEEIKLAQQQEEKIRLEELRRNQEKLQLQQKHKALEEEIYRLNLSLRQQQQIFLRQHEELRNRNNAQQFVPINSVFTTQRPVLNQLQQVPLTNQQQIFKPQNSNTQFDSLIEAGKLPGNAQFLPVKSAQDFRTPFGNNNFNRQNNFNQNFNQQNQGNRFFRQNSGVGNFGANNEFNRNAFNRNNNNFQIQQAISLDNQPQGNRFFRSNLESTFTTHNFLQPPHPTPVQNNRFFRSNLEGTFSSSNNVFNPQVNGNYQLSNLLYNSGAFRGKSPEDLSLISKVLNLNHSNGVQLRPELRQQQFVRNF